MAHAILYPFLDEFHTQEKYFDVDVRIGDRSFKSHRLLLAILSRYFDDLFRGKAGTGNIETVVLDNVDASTFQELLHIMYTGELGIIDDFHALLKACDVLKVRSDFIENQCIIVSRKREPMQNGFTLLKYAHDTKRTNLFEALKRNICNYAEYFFFRDKSFSELPYDLLDEILASGDLKDFISDNADLLANIFVCWIHHSQRERQKYWKPLMDVVKHNLSPEYLIRTFDIFNDFLSKSEYASTPNKIMWPKPECRTRYKSEKFLNLYMGYEDGKCIREFARAPGTLWTPLKEMPHLFTMKQAEIDEKVYCLTYDSTKDLQTFSRRSMSLTESYESQPLKPPPHILRRFQMHSLQSDKLIYVYDEDMDIVGEKKSSGVLIFESTKNDWYAAPPMKQDVQNACMTVDEDSVYLIGGDTTTAPLAQAFQHSTQIWRKLEPPMQMYSCMKSSCCIHQGKLYVMGNNAAVFHCYDLRAGKWEPLRSFHLYLEHCKLISYDNKLWAIGLTVEDNFPVEMCYDVYEQRWSVSQFSFFEAVDKFRISKFNFVIKDCVVL